MCESVGWWCSNLNTYGKSLSFPLVHFFSGFGGWREKWIFQMCYFICAIWHFFHPLWLLSLLSLCLSLPPPACCGCPGGMMIVILVWFTTGRIVVTMINVETEIIDTLKVFSPSQRCQPVFLRPRRYGKFHRWPILITFRIMLIPAVVAFRIFLFIAKTMPWQRRWSEGGGGGEEDDDFILIKI